MCCSGKASQQSFGTFIWSQDISGRVNKENVIGLHFYKGAWQIYIKGRMSKAQSDGIIGSRIKTWLPGRQKAMISWAASKVMWEKYVGFGSVWSPETSTVGWISAEENPQQDPCICLPEHKQSPHWGISQEESQLSPLTDDLHWELGRSSRDHWESNSADGDGQPLLYKNINFLI